MSSPHDVILAPVVTEKSTMIGEKGNKYVFWVQPKANKSEIKKAIEKVFKVKVSSVNTERMPGKLKRMGKYAGRRPVRKKAYVTLKGEDRIDLFEGV